MTPTREAPGRPMRVLIRLLLIGVLSSIAAVGLAGPASAHNVLISSDPADGAVLQTAPGTVRLTFDQPVQNFQPVVAVLGPDGQRYESGSPQVDSTQVSATVSALPAGGEYTIAYRVVSADGHPVQGEVKFQLADSAGSGSAGTGATASGSADAGDTASAASSPGASAAGPTGPTSAAVTTTSSSSGLSGWVWAAIALAAVMVVAAVVVVLRRPRPDQR